MVASLARILERTANLIIFSHDLWIFEQCKKLEDNLIGNIENSVVVTTYIFELIAKKYILISLNFA
jgi:chaperonin GroEL (HSP60 family)